MSALTSLNEGHQGRPLVYLTVRAAVGPINLEHNSLEIPAWDNFAMVKTGKLKRQFSSLKVWISIT